MGEKTDSYLEAAFNQFDWSCMPEGLTRHGRVVKIDTCYLPEGIENWITAWLGVEDTPKMERWVQRIKADENPHEYRVLRHSYASQISIGEAAYRVLQEDYRNEMNGTDATFSHTYTDDNTTGGKWTDTYTFEPWHPIETGTDNLPYQIWMPQPTILETREEKMIGYIYDYIIIDRVTGTILKEGRVVEKEGSIGAEALALVDSGLTPDENMDVILNLFGEFAYTEED